MKRPLFVAIEGADGVGKDVQADLLAQRLDAWRLSQPSNFEEGAALRQRLVGRAPIYSPQEMALRFLLDAYHLAHLVRQQLAAGRSVVVVRWVLSSLVYQADSLSRATLLELNAGIVRPDVTIVLDVPPDVAAARRRARGGPEELYDATDGQVEYRRRYAEEARGNPAVVPIVDGVGSIAEVAARVWAAVESRAARRAA